MQIVKNSGSIDMRNTMYPSIANLLQPQQSFAQPAWSTCYGIVLEGTVKLYNNKTVVAYEYFCIVNNTDQPQNIVSLGTSAVFTRLGFLGQNSIGGPIEKTGRLSYIDGCSDSLLVYPPRQGDPSLNLLVFPAEIDQTFHLHPSVRLGIVVSGNGTSCLKTQDIALDPGTMFCLEPQEIHRFSTQETGMCIVIYHPDGNWGPTDHDHVMINRTYLHK